LELKCKSYERNKKTEKERSEPTEPNLAQPANLTRRPARQILCVTRSAGNPRARPTLPDFILSFRSFRTYLYLIINPSLHSNTNIFFLRNPEILSSETLTLIFEALNFVICLRHLNQSCRSRRDASIPTNLISFRPL
jgi:hypothetical protein